MNKKDFISGSILEFKIPLGLGFAYCKILDFRNIRGFDGVLAKVFDFIVKDPIKDINVLRDKDWLFGARRLYGLPNTRGKGAWKFKGVLISKDDDLIPDFKYSYKTNPYIDDESIIEELYVIKNLRESDDKLYSYNQVNHLENTVVGSQYGIEIRTAMEILRNQNLDVTEYFDLSESANKNIYKHMMNVPLYKSIPKEHRGKAKVG